MVSARRLGGFEIREMAITAAEKDSKVKGGESDLEGKEPHNDPRPDIVLF